MCYKSFNSKKSWKDAEIFCQNLGGHLPSIHNISENDFLTDLNPGWFWLGGTDQGQEGVWRWTDGSAFTFQYWNTGEPNNDGSGEHCAHKQGDNDKWNDYVCTYPTLTFVCQKSKKHY